MSAKLHLVTESATPRRRTTAERISLHAQVLTDEHGLDGFTMDDLAVAAGVSRRTLFNHFPGKHDAVAGLWPSLPDGPVAVFRDGGPDHDLLADLRALIAPLLADAVVDRDEIGRWRRIMLAEPRLLGVVQRRYEALSTEIVGHIAHREGQAFEAMRARVAISLLAALFDAALEEFLHDEHDRDFLHHFDEGLRTARSLLGG